MTLDVFYELSQDYLLTAIQSTYRQVNKISLNTGLNGVSIS